MPNCATSVSFDTIPQIVTGFVLVNFEHYAQTLKLVSRATPTFFDGKQFQFAKSFKTFTARELELIPMLN